MPFADNRDNFAAQKKQICSWAQKKPRLERGFFGRDN